MNIKPCSSTRVQPRFRAGSPKTIPLSILDATCAEIAVCGAVWYFDALEASPSQAPKDFESSLSVTLNHYSQWCGKVKFVEYEHPTADHTRRQGRLTVTYGSDSDPGVELVTATCSSSLSEIISSADSRRHTRSWDTSDLDAFDFLPKTRHAPRSEDENAPCMICQVTTFACGGTAIAVSLTHSLSDAQGLSTFMRTWSENHRLGAQTIPKTQPVFAPQLLDAAAGAIDTRTPDAELIGIARSLPCNRYDTHLPSTGPAWSRKSTPSGIDSGSFSQGEPQPFQDWDLSLPVSSHLLHYSGSEIEAIWNSASLSAPGPVSKHDAILAHIWILINRARFPLESDHVDDVVHLDVSFGVRKRLNPPLPNEFLGSPIMVANIELPVSSLIGVKKDSKSITTLTTAAQKIHNTLSLFTTAAVQALLHDAAHEPCAQRLWQSFLGRKHVILTSWVHLGLYDFDFGIGPARFVQPLLLAFDGIVEIMEAAPKKKHEGVEDEETDLRKKHWTDDGVDLYVFLESGALNRLLADAELTVGNA